MSEGSAEVVRHPLTVGERRRRRVVESLALRFPRLLAFLAGLFGRLPPTSRLRRAASRRFIQFAIEATNRTDYEAAMLLYHPEVESTFPAEFATVGSTSVTHGREARIRFQERWYEDWDGWRIEPDELIDIGDHVLVLGRIKATGLHSGATIDTEVAFLLTVPAGMATEEVVFRDHRQALEAAGLSD